MEDKDDAGGRNDSSRIWELNADEYGDNNPDMWYGAGSVFDTPQWNLDFNIADWTTAPNANVITHSDAPTPNPYQSQIAQPASSSASPANNASAPLPAAHVNKPWQHIAEAPPLMKPVGRAGDKTLHVGADGQQLSAEERKALALERNRSAALRSRTRKKLWLTELETKVEALKAEQVELKSERSALQDKIVKLKEQIVEIKEELLQSGGRY
ncbi:hypothetical protein E3P99_03268 [Wallemia hederae]|uniref:BZIP domain-containing protein n=1 Tax=Wallemia hederae TaxID=1540922 RepID=A0A4T0FGW2_9BASI|nr:hypothetical protein E3P99_03268 [Wallemia hederae]